MEEKISADEIKKILDENEERLRRYVFLLAKANELARLTGPSDEETLWRAHVADCAAALPLLPRRGEVIDVGTGGGLPGIVWAVCRPSLRVTLLDSVSRKCALVEKIAIAMGLSNVEILCARSEDYAKKRAEKFDAAAARAVCTACALAEYLSPFARRGGKLLAFKGPKAREELAPADGKWKALGLSEPRLVPYELDEMSHCIVVWDKISATPKGIPRRPGMAEKFPWHMAQAKKR